MPETNPHIDQVLSDIENFETSTTQPQSTPIIIEISPPNSPEENPTTAPHQQNQNEW